MKRKIKENQVDSECTFNPKFFTKPETRANAKPKRKNQATLLLELEKDHDDLLQKRVKIRKIGSRPTLLSPERLEIPDLSQRGISFVKNKT